MGTIHKAFLADGLLTLFLKKTCWVGWVKESPWFGQMMSIFHVRWQAFNPHPWTALGCFSFVWWEGILRVIPTISMLLAILEATNSSVPIRNSQTRSHSILNTKCKSWTNVSCVLKIWKRRLGPVGWQPILCLFWWKAPFPSSLGHLCVGKPTCM